MGTFRAAAWLAAALSAQAQSGPLRPEFSAHHIGPSEGGAGGWLWPGRVFSIYGKNLGPEQSCVRDAGFHHAHDPNSPDDHADARRILPKEICGVEVRIDEEAVELIYVHKDQINFLAPRGGSFGSRVALRVIRDGVSSVPVSVKLGPDQIRISQPVTAYTGMPVWVRVQNFSAANSPVSLAFGIPWIWPLAECPHIEVMYNGSPLAELKTRNPRRRIVYSGPPCGSPPLPDRQSLAGRIPLHLRYRFERPGTYLVRYVPGSGRFHSPVTAESPWRHIQVQAGSEAQRRKWLRAQAATAPSDREALIYDFLPSIFGYGDTATLRIALKYLYHPDAFISGATVAYLRDYYAGSALVPALEQTVTRRGTNRTVNELLQDLRAALNAR
jgi:hypothetical protein